MPMLIRLVRMTFRPGETDTFLHIFGQARSLIRSFPGCFHLELLRDADDSRIFSTLSHWRDAEALEMYRQSALFQETWAQTKVLFAEKPAAFSMYAYTDGNQDGNSSL